MDIRRRRGVAWWCAAPVACHVPAATHAHPAADAKTGLLDRANWRFSNAIPRDPDAGSRSVLWMLSNTVPPAFAGKAKPASLRNTLVLSRSENLRDWERRSVILHHPDHLRHGFQYGDWPFDGDDLVVVSRTACAAAAGGAHTLHDANHLTFHRIGGFRFRTMADGPVDPATLGW